MTPVTLAKHFFTLARIVLVVIGAVACTREKPFESSIPAVVQMTTPIPGATTPAPSGAATTPVTPITLVLGPTEAPNPTATLVVSSTAPSLTATPVSTSASSASSVPGTYTVQWGDWLSKIAAQFGVTTQAIIAANPGINPNVIYPGQVLRIPSPGEFVPTPSSGGITPPTNPSTYTVQRGEWFYSIARKFGVSVAELQAANPGANPNFLYPGQVLNIPGSGASGTTPVSSATSTPGTGGSTTYTVRPGDTLFSIAVRFHTTTYAIQIANHLPNPNAIYPGMVLIIPQ